MRLLGWPARAALTSILLAGGCDDPTGDLGIGSYDDPTQIPVGGDLSNVDPTADTDADGVPDKVEGSLDANGNGVPAHLDSAEQGGGGGGTNTTGYVPAPTGDGGIDIPDANIQPEYDGCGVVSSESQFERAPVDVIWAIDNSGSMFDDFLNVSAGLAEFTNSVANSGANIRVVMVSAYVISLDQAVQNDTETYNLRFVDVQSTNAFRVLLNDYSNYSSFLRPEAATHVIVVTDDTSDMAHGEFRTQMETNLGHEFYFHAIAANQGIGLGPYGTAYQDLAAETGGQSQPINGDWNAIFDQLESAIVQTAALPCEIDVPDATGRDLNNVQVLYQGEDMKQAPFPKAGTADECGEAVAWHYDDNDAPSQIILCPAACESVKKGGSLDVVFACEPPPPLL